jgi:hypothetical protein
MLHERSDLSGSAPSGQDRRRGLVFAQEATGEHGVERVKRVQPFRVRPPPRGSGRGLLHHVTVVGPYIRPLVRLSWRLAPGFHAFRTSHLALLSR